MPRCSTPTQRARHPSPSRLLSTSLAWIACCLARTTPGAVCQPSWGRSISLDYRRPTWAASWKATRSKHWASSLNPPSAQDLAVLVGVVHPADEADDAAAQVRADKLKGGEVLPYAANDHAGDGQGLVRRPADAGDEAVHVHDLLAEAGGGRVDEARDVQRRHQ